MANIGSYIKQKKKQQKNKISFIGKVSLGISIKIDDCSLFGEVLSIKKIHIFSAYSKLLIFSFRYLCDVQEYLCT